MPQIMICGPASWINRSFHRKACSHRILYDDQPPGDSWVHHAQWSQWRGRAGQGAVWATKNIKKLSYVNFILITQLASMTNTADSPKERVIPSTIPLKKNGVNCAVRAGTDIDAACGQLRSQYHEAWSRESIGRKCSALRTTWLQTVSWLLRDGDWSEEAGSISWCFGILCFIPQVQSQEWKRRESSILAE